MYNLPINAATACKRCRIQGLECDIGLPACYSCEEVGAECLDVDLHLSRDVPRGYSLWQEERISYLEGLLNENNVAFTPAAEFRGRPWLDQAVGNVRRNRGLTSVYIENPRYPSARLFERPTFDGYSATAPRSHSPSASTPRSVSYLRSTLTPPPSVPASLEPALELSHARATSISRHLKSSDIEPSKVPALDYRSSLQDRNFSGITNPRTLAMSSEVFEYIEKNFARATKVGDVIVVTGEDQNAWCSTCREQLLFFFPTVADAVMDLFDEAVMQRVGRIVRHYPVADDVLRLRLTRGHMETEVCVLSRRSSELIEATFACFRHLNMVLKDPGKNGLCLSETNMSDARAAAGLGIVMKDLVPFRRPACWHGLFPRKAIGRYAVPKRNPRMRGLEVSWDMMLHLAGIEFPVDTDEGLILAGFYTTLKPMLKIGEEIQWHLETKDRSCNTTATKEGSTTEREALAIEILHHLTVGDMGTKRHYIGWCGEAVVTLGSAEQNYGEITRTQASEQRSEIKPAEIHTGVNVGWGGPSWNFGVTYAIASTEQNTYIDRNNSYRMRLLEDRKKQLLLYECSKRQAWLVPKTSVILHMLLTWMHHSQRLDPTIQFADIPYCQSAYDGAQRAYAKLVDCMDIDSGLGENERPLFLSHVVKRIWFALDGAARSTWRTTNKVFGYEFLDMVCSAPPFSLKRGRVPIAGLTKGWPHLLDRVQAVLFFHGIDDPIVPVLAEKTLCKDWRRLPEGEDYLAATMQTLRDWTEFYGCNLYARGQLTRKVFWHPPNENPFARCGGTNEEKCTCQRSQKVFMRSALNPLRFRTDLWKAIYAMQQGAVVFRQGSFWWS